MEALDEEVDRQVQACNLCLAKLRGRHAAIQALWDGDTERWFIRIEIVMVKKSIFPWGRRAFVSQPLTCLRYGGDIRVFSGSVPPWPEAMVAERVGKRLAETHKLPFYFPSPSEPDDDCPPWWLRDAFGYCRTCGKPLHRDYGPPSCRDQCSPCKESESHRRELQEDTPGTEGNRGVFFYFLESGRLAQKYWLNLSRKSAVSEALDSTLRLRTPATVLSERTDAILTTDEVVAIVHSCEKAIDAALIAYKPRTDLPPQFRDSWLRTFTWRGEARSIEVNFNPTGEELYSLLGYHGFFTAAASAGPVHIAGNGGITQRDVSILVHFAGEGTFTLPDLLQAFPSLSANALKQTLTKLERRGFLVCEGERVQLLPKGLVVDIAGPP